MANSRRQSASRLSRIGRIILTLPLIALLLSITVVLVGAYFVCGLFLQAVIWICWCSWGRRVLLVYSDSPVWKGYLEQEIIPRLPKSTIVLNWSQRRRWRWWSLAVLAFCYFGGYREYNPLAVVFRPFRWARTYRFYKAFRDFKHGRTQKLEKIVHNLFQSV